MELESAEDFVTALDHIASLGARNVQITTEAGCYALLRAERTTVRLHASAPEVEPVSVVGAGDVLLAAFLAARAALGGPNELVVEHVALNDTRTGFFRALRAMGAALDLEPTAVSGGESVGTVRVRPSALAAISVGSEDVPAMIDELPLLACVAARAEGVTTIAGAAELRVKESDRIAAVVANLRAVGADAEEAADGLQVTGGAAPLRGRVTTHGDHRIAMAFGVLAALPGNAITIDDPECVAVSYPHFWRDLAAVGGG
jgi:3-phosphoshikimate 1-carboxyvinyltransferase